MRNISNRPILKRIGTPADTDVSTDILNLDGKADTISTAVVTDIPATITTLDGKADTISTAVVTDIPATITTLDGKADTISTAVVTDIPATLGTPTGADIATDLANIQTEVDKIGTPTDTDLSTDLSNLDGKADTISTAVVTDIPATIIDLKSDSEEILRYTSAKGVNMWYCDASVVSSGDGTSWATAFKTIQEAEDARGEGDSVFIRPGTYDEDASITGLTIAKDGGSFLSTGESYESVIVRNTNAGATHCINVSGDSNSFKGILARETGLTAWEISGSDNQLTRCSATSSATGMLFSSTANSNSLDDCRIAFCTLNGYDLNGTATFISNSVAAGCNNGAVMSSTSVASVLRNVVISDCGATGFHIESGSTLAALFNCSGSNTVDILDEGVGSSRIVGFNQKSKILDGNSEQEDLKVVYDGIENLKTYTSSSGKVQWYVDNQITESGNGTSWGEAFKTIQEAVDEASDSDIIVIAPGFYDENTNPEGLLIEDKRYLKLVGTGTGAFLRNTHASATACCTIQGTTKQSALGNELNNIKVLSSAGVNCIDLLDNSRSTIFRDCWFQEGDIGINSTGDYSGVTFAFDTVFFMCGIGFSSTPSGTGGTLGLSFISNCRFVGIGASTTAISLGTSMNDIIKGGIINGFTNGIITAAGTTNTVIDGISFANVTTPLDLNGTGETVVNCNIDSLISSNNTNQDDFKAVYDNSTKLKEFTIDLSQAAGTYDICEADGDILVEQFNTYVSQAGSTFNYATIQTNDDTALFLIDSTDGVVGNLTLGKQIFVNYAQLMMNGKSFRLEDGKKLQYTIDGDTGSGQIKLVLKYREISASATLI